MNLNFQAEWCAAAKQDDCISLWEVPLKRETILQMTQHIPPKATLTYAPRCCHSAQLKTHRGPPDIIQSSWHTYLRIFFLSFFFLGSRHHFCLSPFCRIRRIQTKTRKWKRSGSSRFAVGSERGCVAGRRDASMCSSPFESDASTGCTTNSPVTVIHC